MIFDPEDHRNNRRERNMPKPNWRIIACAGMLLIGQAAIAEELPMVLLPAGSAVKYGPAPATLPKGIEISVLAGDPAKPGPFVLRVKMLPDVVIAPHTHATAENLTILSGVLYHEMGEKVDKPAGDKLTSGGFVYLPAKMPHSVWTGAEPVEFQVAGTGPFGVDYLNPADDPSKASKSN
jgi:quercetin dioxygenase-like cupin family protein